MCWLHQGDRERARIWVRRAIRLARNGSLPVLQASWLVELGRIELDRGNLEVAARCADGALQIARPRALWLTVFRAEWLGHLIARQSDDRPAELDRLSYLDKLATRLKRHAGDPTVQEYLAYRSREGETPGRPS